MLDRSVDKTYFQITSRGSSWGVEIRAGLCTFLTVSYILVLNPQILSAAGLPVKETTSSTALVIALTSILSGLLSNTPFILAPSGLNAYLAYSEVLGRGVSLPAALACCLAASAVVLLLTLTRAVTLVMAIVPNTIKLATVVGMGLLLSLIGLKTAGIVVANPETMVALGDLLTVDAALAAGGLALIATLHHNKVSGSILLGMTCTALCSFIIRQNWPTQILALPSLSHFPLDFTYLAELQLGALSAVLAYVLVMIFDIGGAIYGLSNLAGLTGAEGGSIPGSQAVFICASLGSALGAYLGITPLIITAESAVGIKEGGRTGVVSIVVGLCFLVSLFLSPLIQALPAVTTTPVLVLVGAMMMGEAGHVDWTRMTSAIPAFLTIVVQPFTFSIANGIYAGIASSFILYVLTGDMFKSLRGMLDRATEPVESPGEETTATTEDLEQPLISKAVGSMSNVRQFPRVASITDLLKGVIDHGERPIDRTPELLIGNARASALIQNSSFLNRLPPTT
ncbi:hypothetical protein CEUSTIGMA_g5510.t1 [Chlamydomonas eustigma]|uniref:Uncharacterized protein n=1 Tax=Chlamydomonas eustigma TaxID=1157962 RepID=A0A250X4R6_9CHLO|nr:hypothetical protein CEUSTIGMA_g5510.t1 [Chlamydomonas eustigma]|eukprot:GAX78068.1 hypothetical protein CEUSTIGMA_g5510.t1 [Chlamydomonas eustigma]